jgi:ribosomal protein S18 acetylase RimI-like enzyme
MKEIHIREMVIEDYDRFLDLMKHTSGVVIRTADSADAIQRYLERNPGLSFIAERGPKLVGCAMAGHDGRRGYLQHAMVAPEYRRQGIGKQLVARCVDVLNALGIYKIHLDVLAENRHAMSFWKHLGWTKREDIVRFSLITSEDKNA